MPFSQESLLMATHRHLDHGPYLYRRVIADERITAAHPTSRLAMVSSLMPTLRAGQLPRQLRARRRRVPRTLRIPAGGSARATTVALQPDPPLAEPGRARPCARRQASRRPASMHAAAIASSEGLTVPAHCARHQSRPSVGRSSSEMERSIHVSADLDSAR